MTPHRYFHRMTDHDASTSHQRHQIWKHYVPAPGVPLKHWERIAARAFELSTREQNHGRGRWIGHRADIAAQRLERNSVLTHEWTDKVGVCQITG